MLDFDAAQRLARMQERLRTATYHEIRKDGHHKSSEGAITVSFCMPPVVGDTRKPEWRVEVYSYLLCPEARSDLWYGQTAVEAISKAEDAIDKWCFSSEMEMFERRMGLDEIEDTE